MKPLNKSQVVKEKGTNKNTSRLIKAMQEWAKPTDKDIIKPNGVFGSVAIVKCNGVTINSNELDLEFSIPFDDDMEANEAEIIVYNLSKNTISKLKRKKSISVEAGYDKDTGVVFNGFIDRVTTKRDGAEKITTIKCFDDVTNKSVESLSFAAGTKASYILKTLLNKTGLPIAVFKVRRDWTYKDEETVDGDLMQNIKKYSEVCGISTYVNKGKIYSRYIKNGDNINFTVDVEHGMIGSPEQFEEEQTAEDYKETVTGYNVQMLLQHRMTTAAIVKIKSLDVNGTFRVRKGKHTFNESEAITEIEVI